MIEELPRGYAGFKEAICLKELFDEKTGLCVITGKNGSGKTKLLSYCYDEIRKNNRSNRNIAIFREANYNWEEEDDDMYSSFYKFYRGKKNISFLDIILGNVVDESKEIQNKEHLITVLFSENDYYKSLRENVCTKIFPDVLKKYIDENDIEKIKLDLGYPTKIDIKKEIDKKIHADKKLQKSNFVRAKKENEKIKKEVEDQYDKLSDQEKHDYFIKINNNNNDKIDSAEKLINRLMKFSSFSKRINTVIKDLSELIYNDYIRSKKPENSIWAKINRDYLNKYPQFKYLLAEPHSEMSYNISFCLKDKTDGVLLTFKDLSTGEKALFELFYYVYETSDEKLATNWIFLDELDANLNPEFIKVYIEILGRIKKKKKIFISTHNPITVISAEPQEVFELDREESCIKRAKNKEDKREILENLAPGFFIEDDFGYIGMALGASGDVITVFCEGEGGDKFYLENALDNLSHKIKKINYKFISCGSASVVKNVANLFRSIPYLNKLLENKKIVFLFDHDDGGYSRFKDIIDKNDNCSDYRAKVKFPEDKNLQFYALLLPLPDYLKECSPIPSQGTDKFGYAIEHMHLIHSKEDYNNLIEREDSWKSIKTALQKDVKNGVYSDYSNFERLFNTIENLFKG